MVKRCFIDAYIGREGEPRWATLEHPEGEFMYASDALPYMVWQPIPEDLAELPKVELLLRCRDGAALSASNKHGRLTEERRWISLWFTHWALAPVFKEEERA